MAITVRALLKSAAGLLAALLGAGSALALAPQRETLTLTMAGFIARLRQDPGLRRRFVDDPRAILRDYGIDPAPYRFPDRMSAAQLDRLLAQFAQAAPTEPPTPPVRPPPGPAPVYGPPPGPRRPPPITPPAPVYGPPPGLPR